MKKNFPFFLILLIASTLYFLPILINPKIILERGNDLQGQFWPVFYFIRENFLKYRELPLWNNLFFSGTPILPDPQFSLFYPPNSLFLIFPTNIAFILYIFLHLLLGTTGMYLLSRKGFSFSQKASFLSALIYLLTPRISGYLEAGHITLIAASAWLPFLVMATLFLAKKPSYKWLLIFSVSLAGLFYTHTLIFISTLILIICLFLYLLKDSQKKKMTSTFFFCLGIAIALGLTAITLLPQIKWSRETTRLLLITNPDVYPKWFSKKEFLTSVFLPWLNGIHGIWKIETEKWLTLGIIPMILGIYGLLKLKKTHKIIILVLLGLILLLSLNNLSPLYPFLLKQKWYTLLRVTTRLWYINNFTVALLSGLAIDFVSKKSKAKWLVNLIIIFAIIESSTLSWIYLSKPINKDQNLAPETVYQFLKEDKTRFRVFCLNRCLSQQSAAIHNLELVEGYNTLSQINYFRRSWQLMGGFWNYYTLAIPPIGIYPNTRLVPDAKSLGEYNVKYIISPYQLEDKKFILKTKIENYHIYENKLLQPRANAPIVFYSPNNIRIDTESFKGNQIILAEVYNSDWKAFLNGVEEVLVQETPESLRAVDLQANTKFVDFKYKPKSFSLGKIITIATLVMLVAKNVGAKTSLFNHNRIGSRKS